MLIVAREVVDAIILVRDPVEPFVVKVVTVCVTPEVSLSPFARPALLTFRDENVLAPDTVILSPENVTVLKVFPPPTNDLFVEEVSVTETVDVFALKVSPVVIEKFQTTPVPVTEKFDAPSVNVLVLLELPL
jgi:hypothetical protein